MSALSRNSDIRRGYFMALRQASDKKPAEPIGFGGPLEAHATIAKWYRKTWASVTAILLPVFPDFFAFLGNALCHKTKVNHHVHSSNRLPCPFVR